MSPSVHQIIFDNEGYPRDEIADKDDRKFFFYLQAAMAIAPEVESAVDGFTAHLLSLLGYEVGNRFIRQRKDLFLFVSSGRTLAETHISVVNQNHEILLVMQEYKKHLEKMDPEPRLIVQAITPHQHNIFALAEDWEADCSSEDDSRYHHDWSYAEILQNPHYARLCPSVEIGQYPEQATIVHMIALSVNNLNRLVRDGMKSLNNRDIILRCFEAFKQFVYGLMYITVEMM